MLAILAANPTARCANDNQRNAATEAPGFIKRAGIDYQRRFALWRCQPFLLQSSRHFLRDALVGVLHHVEARLGDAGPAAALTLFCDFGLSSARPTLRAV